MICLDEMGPESATSVPGQRVVAAAERTTQEADYGRRGKGYVFGAFRPATGAACTVSSTGRTTANWVDFLEQGDRWLGDTGERVYAILDNLSTHPAADVLL